MTSADPTIRVAIDVGGESYRVGIADPAGKVLEEFVIPHTRERFQAFFDRVEQYRRELNVPGAVAMEGQGGHVRPLDRLIREKGYALYNVLKPARFRGSSPGRSRPVYRLCIGDRAGKQLVLVGSLLLFHSRWA